MDSSESSVALFLRAGRSAGAGSVYPTKCDLDSLTVTDVAVPEASYNSAERIGANSPSGDASANASQVLLFITEYFFAS